MLKKYSGILITLILKFIVLTRKGHGIFTTINQKLNLVQYVFLILKNHTSVLMVHKDSQLVQYKPEIQIHAHSPLLLIMIKNTILSGNTLLIILPINPQKKISL